MEPSRTENPGHAKADERPLVWVLDDSPLEAALARRALASGFEVEVFADGSTMLECIAAGRRPTVLVLDWLLPGLTGIEVCRFLRSTHDEMDLPILMLTVYGHNADLVEGLSAGANDYLTKPYAPQELAARVATLARIHVMHKLVKVAERQAVRLLERERESRAEAEAANRAKDEFLATVSHELRTPLNAILGWTRIVRGGDLRPDQVNGALARVEASALAQTKLIEDLLDVTRIVSGQLAIHPEPLDMVTVIMTAIDAVRPAAEKKNIRLRVEVQPDAGLLLGDASRLQQVIWNLLVNAIKFTGTGGEVTLAYERVDARLRISVVDTGQGIAPEFLPHVFERFRQADRGAGRAHPGLGIGLAIVKHIVELHGGTVEASSPGVGKGATFRVEFPGIATKRSSAPPAAEPLEGQGEEAPASKPLENLRVLVVDDDLDSRELVGMILIRQGADVLSAGSADAALEIVSSSKPDVVVSDIAMPNVDGHELMRRLRALAPGQGGRTPAIALTAFARSEDRTHALAAGFNMYASKPIDSAELVVSVASLAGRFAS